LGEPQIFGQMKIAFRTAQERGTLGTHLYRLFHHAFGVTKRIRTETAIGESATSAASAAVQLALQVFDGFEQQHALMIGAGEMIETAAGHLTSRNIAGLTIANRSLERGKRLAEKLQARAVGLASIGALLPTIDMVFSSTASPDLIVTAEQLATAVKKRKHRPMFVVDLAVPRDIEPAAAEISDVYLYTIDDLHRAVGDNLDARRVAANAAEKIIDTQAELYARGVDRMDAVPTIRALREQTRTTRDRVLAQARRQLASGKSPDMVLEWMANALTNKIMHAPSTALRKAGEESDSDMLEIARRMFSLNDDD
ncbi:MAG: glutamyl-tRNA reductase, partial [Gammaproteobacteria bacterium]|nr:glutamyl-tRNA reductase [Gammaproteobacteria bacterium]